MLNQIQCWKQVLHSLQARIASSGNITRRVALKIARIEYEALLDQWARLAIIEGFLGSFGSLTSLSPRQAFQKATSLLPGLHPDWTSFQNQGVYRKALSGVRDVLKDEDRSMEVLQEQAASGTSSVFYQFGLKNTKNAGLPPTSEGTKGIGLWARKHALHAYASEKKRLEGLKSLREQGALTTVDAPTILESLLPVLNSNDRDAQIVKAFILGQLEQAGAGSATLQSIMSKLIEVLSRNVVIEGKSLPKAVATALQAEGITQRQDYLGRIIRDKMERAANALQAEISQQTAVGKAYNRIQDKYEIARSFHLVEDSLPEPGYRDIRRYANVPF